jgi:ABC-type Mn2+/Zn2+ transport system ATPase subunit
MNSSDLPLLSLTDVSHSYGSGHVIDGVNLAIHSGQLSGIVGPSGSGKTTLLRVLLGGITPTHGTVTRHRELLVGYVPQVEVVNWNFPVTVAETVIMARPPRRFNPRTSVAERREASEVLERLGIGDLGHRHIRELSGGQQQRVFIARALVGKPDLLLMDEPTSGVDVRTRHEILHLLEELNRGGLSIMLTTHDLNGMAAHLPHLICINRSIRGQGTPGDVLTSEILEATYGAPMDVLQHAGMPLVVDRSLRIVDDGAQSENTTRTSDVA